MINSLLLLVLGFVFTFFIPGYLIIETFFTELHLLVKFPLYLIISVLSSTYLVYFVSLVFGFSRFSILLSFLPLAIWFVVFIIKKKPRVSADPLKQHAMGLVLSSAIFALFLIALYPAIFYHRDNYFVMSAVNWQDTAMHLSIIESISQGNFPPQAPYFSGHPLSYYYFIDFHTAILQTLYGDFFPRVLVYDNPFFAAVFFLSVYVLGYEVTRNQSTALISGLLTIFCGNFFYFKFFQDIFKNLHKWGNFLPTLKDLVANNSYTLDYGKLMQLTPMADYFLQNRPMMIGLPSVVLIIILLIEGFRNSGTKNFILAGLLTSMLVKFQLFGFAVGVSVFILSWLTFSHRSPAKGWDKLTAYLIPLVIFIALISTASFMSGAIFKHNFMIDTFLANFHLGPWQVGGVFFWYLLFPFANFGVLIVLSMIAFLLIVLRKIVLTREIVFLLLLATFLYAIPHLVKFTVYDFDMLKFFYFLFIPLSLLSALVLGKISFSAVGKFLMILIIIASSFNSFLTLGASFFNTFQGYSLSDYRAGIWIRKFTSPSSVFVTYPSVHSAVSDIGGRLRVLSYTVWPYSHGFNAGEDNVFSRQENIEKAYENPDRENIKKIVNLYHASYLYLGGEEKSRFPAKEELFNNRDYLKPVYNSLGTKIYKINI